MSTLYLCGAGNPDGVRLARLLQRNGAPWDHIEILDDDPKRLGERYLGVEVTGPFDRLADADPRAGDRVASLVARTATGRAAVRARLLSFGVPFAPLVHPSVELDGAVLPDDVIAYAFATVGAETVLEPGCVLFMGAVAGHESHLGPCSILASNAVVNARAVLGEAVYVGSNASVFIGCHIGARATVGAGSSVVTDVPAGASAVGVPAEVLLPGAAPRDGASCGAEELEAALRGAFEANLAEPARVRTTANFFDMGATSLQLMLVREAVRQQTGVALPLTAFFRYPTIERLVAAQLDDAPRAPGTPGAPEARSSLRRAAAERARQRHPTHHH